jgi:hypothetical protein
VHYILDTSCNYRQNYFSSFIPLVMCSLLNIASKQTQNSVTNFSKMFNYIAPASLFYSFTGSMLSPIDAFSEGFGDFGGMGGMGRRQQGRNRGHRSRN